MSLSKIDSEDMRQALQALADSNRFIELPQFLETALYHPQLGYYRRDKQRVGRDPKSDFYTATSLREAFAEIVVEATVCLLEARGLDPAETTWVEIGAEPNAALLHSETDHPFASTRTIRAGENIELTGQLAVFSNELFDAQPFRQLRFEKGNWSEFGVTIEGDQLSWTRRTEVSEEAKPYLDELPTSKTEGYTVDLPIGSRSLAKTILDQPWTGAFVAFDYGKTWTSLIDETPQGTARSYYRHQASNDILQKPGEQDITHHICWDHIENELESGDFEGISLQSQESFIVHRAPAFMQKAFDPTLTSLAPIRTKLKELMHPALMGHKFQAVTATRLGAIQGEE